MTAKNTYWMADPYGNKALVEGVEGRDAWIPRGWAEAGEPAGNDMVWMRHEAHGGRAQFPADALEQWRALGWVPSDPPAPYDLTKDPQLVDVQPAAEEQDPAAGAESADDTTTRKAGRRRADTEES